MANQKIMTFDCDCGVKFYLLTLNVGKPNLFESIYLPQLEILELRDVPHS